MALMKTLGVRAARTLRRGPIGGVPSFPGTQAHGRRTGATPSSRSLSRARGDQQRAPSGRWRWRVRAAGHTGGGSRDHEPSAEVTFDEPSELCLFLDSADVAEWKTYFPTGIFYGITCNPTILERDGVECSIASLTVLAKEAFKCGAKELLLQTWGSTVDEMVSNGFRLADIDERIVVKVPITKAGTETAARLAAEGVDICVTAVYATHQAMSAVALGAAYAAPYLGRMTDAGRPGFDNIVNMQKITEKMDSTTRIMVASIRSADDMALLCAQGLDTFTFSPAVAAEMFADELTIEAAAAFEEAAARNS